MVKHEVTLVRIYLRESEHILGKIVDYLHDKAKVRGMTVLRAVEGFSENGKLRTSFLVDLSLDLPLIIEFYEEPNKAEVIITELLNEFHLPHIVSSSMWVCSL
ncbi:DUF190 domain-containing protein [Candidatus Methylobacter oryzae]|uniref:DUF190 domain-containing protein n=1 Tax=Candidatus Methylobacter oryzae TaxID=2497749 RepID=A0ABY3C4Z3_9GAMM|nr:DUF190 domain-containing protein [Candidatus Methylobacter oryzae]TRW89909.1 DUF190 domain-containing protein [Candidatus Methylobacter oryzae]